MKVASCLANMRGRGSGGWGLVRGWGGPGAPERWNRETGNEFPETGNKTLSQSVTPGGGVCRRVALQRRGVGRSRLHAVTGSH